MGFHTKDDYFQKIIDKFIIEFKESIELEIQLGNLIVIENAKDQGVRTKDTGLTVSKKDLDTWADNMFLHIKDINREFSKDITRTVLNNISNKGSAVNLADDLKTLFKDKKETYKNRYKTIARDQSSEILNTSGRNKAKQLGATTKWASTIFDNKRCEICTESQRLYGEEEKAIPFDENFVVEVNGKIFESMTAKFHIKDRCLTLYGFEG